jgi:nitroreductase
MKEPARRDWREFFMGHVLPASVFTYLLIGRAQGIVNSFKNPGSSSIELLQQIVEAGICAPSSMNQQPWRFVVVTKSDAIKTLSDEAKSELLKFLKTDEAKKKYGDAVERFTKSAESAGDIIYYNAPSVILVIQTKEAANGQFDHGLATQNMLLASHDLGLGSVPVGLSVPLNNSVVAREMLKMGKDEKLVISLPVGYPDETSDELDRDFDVVSWVE